MVSNLDWTDLGAHVSFSAPLLHEIEPVATGAAGEGASHYASAISHEQYHAGTGNGSSNSRGACVRLRFSSKNEHKNERRPNNTHYKKYLREIVTNQCHFSKCLRKFRVLSFKVIT